MNLAIAMAKLAGIRKSVDAVINENVSRNRSSGDIKVRSTFPTALVEHYFTQAQAQVAAIRACAPSLFEDFQQIGADPEFKSADNTTHYSRPQLEKLVRDIEQIFEIRANSELAMPKPDAPRRVFITHGRAQDWRMVQSHIEKDLGVSTMELAQEPNLGLTIMEKLEEGASKCDGAVIVMTGDDSDASGQARVRENVMHEIGYFHGRYGRSRVILLHEEGISTPSNLSGIVYAPFPKGNVEAALYVLGRELRSMYP